MAVACRALEVMRPYPVLLEGCLHTSQVLGNPGINGTKQRLQLRSAAPNLNTHDLQSDHADA